MRADSIIDVSWDSQEIYNNIISAFNSKLDLNENPYGNGQTSIKINNILEKIDLDKKLLQKSFADQ